ncbi:tetratricopeptide repeat-containing sensor histidine kinase [Polaribacter uvawellassae]|uniref:tetratricopeptide repeat-containing sensor histidine kinase n=1 Tax=Polaribacter uvawellassae TaxID=3133495 RepID=UPI0032199BCF
MKKTYILFYLLLVFTLKVVASSIDKGKIFYKEVFPLSVLQQQDTVLQNRYLSIKKSIKKNEYSSSLELSLKLLEDSKKANNKDVEFLSTYQVGELFVKLNNHSNALKYLKKSLTLLLESDESQFSEKIKKYDLSFSRNKALADNFLKLGTEYIVINKLDSARYYFNKIIDLKSLNNDLESIKASAYNNLSGIYIQSSLYDEAKEYSLKAIEIRRKTNNKLHEASALGNLASIYVLEEKYKEAKEVYYNALDLIENDNSSTAFKYKRDLYFNLAWALYNLKDYTAYDYQEKSFIIKDSLRDVEVEHLVKGVYEKFQVDLKKEQVKLEEAEAKKSAWFFGLLSVLIILSSGVIIYNYKLRQKNLKLHLDQTKLEQESNLEKLKSESQVRILNATLDGKEEERKQIAETLHDSVSSLLSSANLHLQASKMQFNGETPVEIDKTQKIIVEASQTIRDLSHTLVSSVLLKFGLKYAIKDMAEKYSNSKIEINTHIKSVRRYQQSFEIKANNIIQELVNNILKHSNATKATVKILDKDGVLFVDIQDDGEGFDKTDIPKKDGLGINQIEARIQMMKGKFFIDSNAETGTKIKIELPILEKKETSHA